MDTRLKSILDYIDGNMTPSQRVAFAKELSSDASLKKEYVYQLNVHNNLSKLTAVKAPESLMDNIMRTISDKSFSAAKYSSFGGIKFIIAMAIVFISLLIVLGFLISSDVVVAYSTNGIGQYLDELTPAIEIPNKWLAYAPYVCLLVAIPLFAALDNYMKGLSIVKS